MYSKYLDIKPEVAKALEEGTPVVALESTIISHGMPYPKNVETAIAVENVLRAHDVMPATIAIIGGRIKIGLTEEEIEYMATAENVLKVSRRDFPLTISQGLDGATTVAGTMIAAHMAGIRLFVTGGIGGVHRGAGESFDISADLEELKIESNCFVSVIQMSVVGLGRLKQIEVGEGCFQLNATNSALVINNCPELVSLTIGKQSFSWFWALHLSGLPALKYITMDANCFMNTSLVLTGLKKLQSVQLGDNCFMNSYHTLVNGRSSCLG